MSKIFGIGTKPCKKTIVVKDCAGELHYFDGDRYKWYSSNSTCRIYDPDKKETAANFVNPIYIKHEDNPPVKIKT